MVDEIVKRRFVLICSIRSVSIVWTTWIKVAYLLFYVHKIQKKSKKRRKNIVKRKIHSIRKHQRKTKKESVFLVIYFVKKIHLKSGTRMKSSIPRKGKKATSFTILFDFFYGNHLCENFEIINSESSQFAWKYMCFFPTNPQID